MADDDLLNAAAEALGVPPEMAMRSAQARAEAEGTTVESVLRAWAGETAESAAADRETPEEPKMEDEAVEAPAEEPPAEADEPAEEPVADEEPAAPAAPDLPPSPETVSVDRAEDFEVVTTVPTASLKERTKASIPGWLGSLFIVLPLVAVLLLLSAQSPECGQAGALEVDPVTGEIVNCDGSEFTGSGPGDGVVVDFLAIGGEIYRGQGACFNCHGASGEGVGTFPALTTVLDTFSSCADHRSWVTLGSTGWLAEVGPSYGDTDKPVEGGMPAFSGLTEEQIASVALFERVEFGRADLEQALIDCELAGPAPADGELPSEDETPPEEGTEG